MGRTAAPDPERDDLIVSDVSIRRPDAVGSTLTRVLVSPVTGGCLIGLGALTAWWNLGPAWTVYLVIAITGLSTIPVIVAVLAGRGLERIAMTGFVFSLQFGLSFNLMYGDYTVAGGSNGLTVSLILLTGLAYCAVWLFSRRLDAAYATWRTSPAFVRACAAFLAATLLSFLTTSDRTNSMFGLAGNLTLVFVALVACHICSRREYVVRTWTLMLVLLVTQCLVYTAQRLTNTSFTLEGEVLQNRGSSGRFGGTMGMAPMGLATLEMVTLFFTQGRLFSKIWKPNWMVAAVFGYGMLGLLLSLTRSCWIGFIFGSILLAATAIRRGAMRPAMLGRMAAFGVLALIVAWGPVHDRMGSNHSAAADERFLLNYINLEMIKAQPLVGIGINQCFVSRWKYIPSFYTGDEWIYMAHNQYLLVAAETGLIGLFTFLWVLWVSVKAAWRAARSDDLLIREVGTVLLISLLALLWGMQLDFYAGMQVYTFLWFIMGFAAGVGRLADEHTAGR